MENRETFAQIPAIKVDIPTLSGLYLLNSLLTEDLSHIRRYRRCLIKREEMKFFDTVSNYLKRYKVDFGMLKNAEESIEKRLPELRRYGVEREAATKLEEEGDIVGTVDIFSGRMRGTYSGNIRGTVSTVSSMKLSKQNDYVRILSETIKEINEPLSRATNFPVRFNEDEFNYILSLLNHNISQGNDINVGTVNEINNRLEECSTTFDSMRRMQVFEGFDGLGEKSRRSILKEYFGKNVVSDKKGSLYTTAAAATATAAAMSAFVFVYDSPDRIVSGSMLMAYMTALVALISGLITSDMYYTFEPNKKLEKRLKGISDINTRNAIEQAMLC